MPFICQYIKLFRVGVYLFTILPCIGQDTDYKESHNTDRSALYSTHSVHITTHYGFIWKHSPRMAHLADSRPFAVELSLHKQTTGRKAWHKLYNYPEIGYSFLYFNLRNPKVLGDAYAIVCYLNVPLYLTPSSSPPRFVHSLLQDSPEGEESGVRSRKGRLYFRIGTGLVYHTNRYDSLENPTNNLFSTSINGVMQSKIEYDKKVSDNISFQAGLMITHFSNGAIKLPNLGINIPTVNVGIRYSPKLNMTKHDPGTVYPVVPVTRDYPTGDINPQKPQQKNSGDMYRYPYLVSERKLLFCKKLP